VDILKPRNCLTFAAACAALLWIAPASAGLVRTLAAPHGSHSTGGNNGTITVHQTTGQHGSTHGRRSRSGGDTGTPPPVTCTDSTTPIIPVS